MRCRLCVFLVPLLAFAGCGSPKGGGPADTLTAGKLRLVAAETAVPLARKESEAFGKLYPGATLELKTNTARGAVGDLFADRADVILMPRELSPEEDSLAAAYKVRIQGWRVGLEALAVVVHPSNPVRQIALDQLREIYTGRLKSWDRLGGSAAPVRTIWSEPNSAAYQLVLERVLAGEKPAAPDAWSFSDSETAARVARDPNALGILGVAAAGPSVKVLRVSEARGFAYFAPDAENVWNQKYPLRHYDVLIYRKPAPPLADGFATYVLSNEGQKAARDLGLVPTAVPIKIHRAKP